MKITEKFLIPILCISCIAGLVGCKETPLNQSPIASLRASTNRGEAPLTVTFDISNSTDPDGYSSHFRLNFGDKSDPLTGDNFSNSIQHTYKKAGEFSPTLTVTDGEGLTTKVSVNITVAPPYNQPPTATINSPPDWTSFEQGTAVNLMGTATDPEDGSLTGGSLVWSSSVDGQLGTAKELTVKNLSLGIHTIILTATDSEGKEGHDEIKIRITEPDDSTTCGGD